jgi:hypothetical protein
LTINDIAIGFSARVLILTVLNNCHFISRAVKNPKEKLEKKMKIVAFSNREYITESS